MRSHRSWPNMSTLRAELLNKDDVAVNKKADENLISFNFFVEGSRSYLLIGRATRVVPHPITI